MIRVLHIMSTVTGGGVERRRLSLAKAFKGSNIQMKLVGTFKNGAIAEQIEDNGVEIIEVGDFNGPFHWDKHRKIQKIIDEFQPHIIHGAVFEGVTMAAINGFIKKVPVVILEETSDPQNRSSKADFLLRIFSWAADRFIAIAPNVAEYLRDKAKVSPKKVITINNGVEIPRAVSDQEIQDLKAEYAIRESDFVVGTVGRLFNDHKKITDILEAVKQLDLPHLKLLIVGGGRDEQLLKEKARELGIEAQVIFTGYQYDTAPFYELMNVFCIASQREGFGLVAAEAMLHHLPVLATQVGGLQNVVVNEETGFLVPSNTPSKLAEKIHYFYHHPEAVNTMGEAGYQRAMQNYTEERYVKEVQALYNELLLKKGII
ncbi:glycosyltransferase family 4 protein [Chryseobacterium sp. VAUSW3]|uniref:glycosyltransferase family 4 protein n=1 Tax=Chryseobacterium sp. VAUSW3 TaxID=2010998 RepID=UPI000B4CED0C|nr:glycosyltransferase family 4 protein [Chryseobacterium sp. VAUSW3]OWR15176.1 group 1 glycosyl transferase [Chryseobacterium sp. VAUSW3]